MRKPGTNPNDVQETDVLCDFCHTEWSADRPFLEGHQGSCLCGHCLTIAYTELVLLKQNTAPGPFQCPMCLETDEDRAALDRANEPGWQSPVVSEAVLCRRCAKLGAGALHKDKETDWRKPTLPDADEHH